MHLFLRRFEKGDLKHLDPWSRAVGSQRFMQKVTPLGYSSLADLDHWGSSFVWYAIVLDGETIGSTWVDRRRREDSLGIPGIIIGRPDKLGRGIGRRAIAMVMANASSIMGIHRFRLTVRQSNLRAIRAYESSGFQVTGQGVTRLSDGTPVPFYRMETMETVARAI
jgi:RimJ/RimL family protein N-acetyltransferase